MPPLIGACFLKMASKDCLSVQSTCSKHGLMPVIFSMPSMTFVLELERLSTITTLYPSCSSSTVVWEPIKPVPPVTNMFFFIVCICCKKRFCYKRIMNSKKRQAGREKEKIISCQRREVSVRCRLPKSP